jgi:hypothetical protein
MRHVLLVLSVVALALALCAWLRPERWFWGYGEQTHTGNQKTMEE